MEGNGCLRIEIFVLDVEVNDELEIYNYNLT